MSATMRAANIISGRPYINVFFLRRQGRQMHQQSDKLLWRIHRPAVTICWHEPSISGPSLRNGSVACPFHP